MKTVSGLLRVAAIVSFLWLGTTYLAWGQGAVTTGTIMGDVTDASGAVLPGANITVRNEGTDLRRHAVTDGNGHFVVLQVPAGQYEITVAATGFKQQVVHGFQVNVDVTSSAKFKLSLGTVNEKLEVSAEAAEAAVDTSKTEVSNVIQEAQVRQLPLNQRSFTALVTQQA